MKLLAAVLGSRMMLLSVLAVTFAFALPAATTDAATTELVTLRDNQFPEGLTVAADGTVYLGILNMGEIMKVTPQGRSSSFARLPLREGALMVGLVVDSRSSVYALVFSNDESNGVWWVNPEGTTPVQFARLPVGSLPNDLIIDLAGRIYVTDTIGGRIFRVTDNGAVETWSQDRLLLGNVASIGPLGFPIGANGIALAPDGQSIYVGVSEFGRLVRIPIRGDGSAGPVTVLAEDSKLVGADGIAVGPAGSIYVSVNQQNQIVTVNPANGRVDVIASGSAFRFPASVRFSPDGSKFYVPNFEGLVFFGLAQGPARPGLLAVDVEASGTIAPPSTGSGGLVQGASTSSVESLSLSTAFVTSLVIAMLVMSGGATVFRRKNP